MAASASASERPPEVLEVTNIAQSDGRRRSRDNRDTGCLIGPVASAAGPGRRFDRRAGVVCAFLTSQTAAPRLSSITRRSVHPKGRAPTDRAHRRSSHKGRRPRAFHCWPWRVRPHAGHGLQQHRRQGHHHRGGAGTPGSAGAVYPAAAHSERAHRDHAHRWRERLFRVARHDASQRTVADRSPQWLRRRAGFRDPSNQRGTFGDRPGIRARLERDPLARNPGQDCFSL